MQCWMMLGPNDKAVAPITSATRFSTFALGSLAAALVTEPGCFPALVSALEDLPPWVPLVAVVPAHLAASLTALLTPLDQARAAQSVIVPHPLAELPDAATLRRLVNQRPPIAPTTLARWIARRLKQPAEVVEALFIACLDQDGSPNGASRRTLHRQVGEILFCRPSDLVRLHDIAVLPRLAPTIEHLADSAGTTATRLAQRVRRALGLTLANYNHRPGWEWPLEAACRHGLGHPDREWGVGSGEWGVGHEGTAPEANVNAPTTAFLMTAFVPAGRPTHVSQPPHLLTRLLRRPCCEVPQDPWQSPSPPRNERPWGLEVYLTTTVPFRLTSST